LINLQIIHATTPAGLVIVPQVITAALRPPVPVIADTAYPRLPADPTPAELEAFTPEAAELAFARQRTWHPGPHLALLVLLKTFQHLGRIVRLADVPTAGIDHVAAAAGLAGHTAELAGYGGTTYRVRLASLVRGFAGVVGYDREARGITARACIEAARSVRFWAFSHRPPIGTMASRTEPVTCRRAWARGEAASRRSYARSRGREQHR